MENPFKNKNSMFVAAEEAAQVDQALADLVEVVTRNIKERDKSGRSFALFITKLEEARNRAIECIQYAP